MPVEGLDYAAFAGVSLSQEFLRHVGLSLGGLVVRVPMEVSPNVVILPLLCSFAICIHNALARRLSALIREGVTLLPRQGVLFLALPLPRLVDGELLFQA